MTANSANAATVTCTVQRGPDDRSQFGDINGDKVSDPVVGVPKVGAVDVHFASGAVRVTEASLTSTPSGGFGTAAVVADTNGDNCADLIVSAPGTGGVPGSVYIIPGSDSGLVLANAIRLRAPEGAGSSWGESLSFLADNNTLVVGAPSSPLAPNSGGAVVLYPLAANGTPVAPTVVTQGAGGLSGASEAGDRFGAALTTTTASGDFLSIGTPGEAIGSRAKAGAVTVLHFTGPTSFAASSFSLSSAGIPGAATAGDEFGTALGSFGFDLAVGLPGRSVGKATHTGAVDLLRLDVGAQGQPLLKSATQIDQGTEFIPGANETGDRFGQSVVMNYENEREIVVGAPYEDIGSAKDAGSVTVIQIPSESDIVGRAVNQKTPALKSKAETGDHFGWTVATVPDSYYGLNQISDSFVVSAPGEDLTGATNAGYVDLVKNVFVSATPTVKPLLPVGGPKAGLAYGTVLGAPDVGF